MNFVTRHIIFRKYYIIHQKALEFAVFVNEQSTKRHEGSKKNVLARGCLFKINERNVVLHRSILSLCEAGWASVVPLHLRSMLDCFINCIAILNKDSEYMAFKFYTIDYLNGQLDPIKTKK